MMGADGDIAPDIVEEVHFDGRRMKCFRDRPRNIDDFLANAVLRNPEGDALVDGDRRFSYSAFNSLVDRIAANLKALRIGPGDRVALSMANRAEFPAVLMAAIRLGAIAVPINVREQMPGFRYILNHSGAVMLVYDEVAADRLPEPAETPLVANRFAIDGQGDASRPFEDLLADADGPPFPHRGDEEDVAIILYTSGTTGRPKGVMLTHFNVCHSVKHFETAMALGPADRSVLAVPASHITGLVANILTFLHCAGCTLILRNFVVEDFLALAARERMTHTLMVPAMYTLCLLRGDVDARRFDAWRIGGYGGAPMPEATIAELADRLPDLNLMNAYGATETASPTTIMPIGATADRPDSVGKSVACGEIRIVRDDGSNAVAGEAGEILIAGPMVTPGYWNDPDTTRTSIVDGYWKSGDVGALDKAGFLKLHDRKKDMIIRGGYNVYSAELENVLSHHDDVAECAAVGHPDPVLGEKIHVFVTAKGEGCSADELKSFCADRLADYKIPDFVTFLDGPLPRNANGKVLKNVLRDRIVSQKR